MAISEQSAAQSPRLTAYFLGVIACSIPFYGLGAMAGAEILPALPISALMIVVPPLVAAAFLWRGGGRYALIASLRTVHDWAKVPHAIWWLPVIAIMPAGLAIAWMAMRVSGVEMPGFIAPPATVLAFFALFLIAGLAEELGWTAYATGPLIARYGTLLAGLILGVVWSLWHTIPYLQTGRGFDWVMWHSLVTVLLRMVMVWLYTRTGGSVFAASLFHAVGNVAFFLFPTYGSHYDPAFFAPVLAVLLLIAFLVPGLRPPRP